MNRPSRIISAALALTLAVPYGAVAGMTPPSISPSEVVSAADSGLTPGLTAIVEAPAQQGRRYAQDWEVPGQIVVSYRSEATARLAAKRQGLTRHPEQAAVRAQGVRIETVEVPEGRDADELLRDLNDDPAVEWAAYETLTEILYTDSPDDPAFTSTRNLSDGSGQRYPHTYSWWLKDQPGSMRISTLWPDLEIDGQPGHAVAASTEVTVAVIDTGFYMDHPDKGSNIVAGRDYFDHSAIEDGSIVYYEDGDVTPVPHTVTGSESKSAHGTCCSGQVGAATDNAEGVASAGFDNRVAVYKVLGTDDDNYFGLGAGAAVIPTSRVAAAIYGAVDDGAKVISMSLGSASSSSQTQYQNAIDYAYANDVLVVAATGNDGQFDGVYYPAACDHAIAVGSYRLDGEDGTDIEVSDFTNYGDELDILAPGELIYGFTRPDYDSDGSDDIIEPGYTFWSGTSMATPALAGAAALLWRFDPSLSPDDLANLIFLSAEDMGSAGWDQETGWGAVRPVAAYNQMHAFPVVSDDAPAYTASDPVTVTITAQDGGDGVASIWYRLDGAATQTVPAATVGVPVSGEGSHALLYWAQSDSGQLSPQQTATFTVDTTAPTTSDDAPAEWQTSALDIALTATDTASGVATTYYMLDGGPEQIYSAPIEVTAEGTTTIAYASVDSVGNRESTQTATIRIDTTAPTSIDDAPAEWQTSAVDVALTATDTASGVATTYYTLDGGPEQTYSAPIEVTAEGTTTIAYASVDSVGNRESTQTATIRIDTDVPAVGDTIQSSYPAKSADFTLWAIDTVSGVDSISYRLDTPGTTETALTDSLDVNVSLPGTRTIEYWSLDVAGNESGHVVEVFYVGADDVPPTVSIDAPLYSPSDPTLFTIEASDAGVGVFSITYTVDGGAPETVYSDTAIDSVSGEATHTITYWATDTNGNVSAPASIHTLTVDLTAPMTSDDAPAPWQTSAVDVTLTAADTASGVSATYYTVDGGSEQTYSAPIEIAAEGTTTIAYASVDGAGNRESTQTAVVRVDTDAPTTTFADLSPYDDEATIALDATDSISGVSATRCSVDGAAAVTYTAPFTVSGYGDHTIEYWSEDVAGNVEAANGPVSIRVRATSTQRISGIDRYRTAVAAAREGWAGGASDWTDVTDVIIASGEDQFAADPLTASGLSWAYEAPLLLVSGRETSPDVLRAVAEIADDNGLVNLHVVGGVSSVPQARVDEITSYVEDNSTGSVADRRVAGSDRYKTAEKIANEVIAEWQARGAGMPDAVLIANGSDPASFYDALALSPIAAANGYPILPVKKYELTVSANRVLTTIGPSTVVIGGGSAAVSSQVAGEIHSITGVVPDRWWGDDRYETAERIADGAVAQKGWLDETFIGVAAGLPDALAGGSMVGSVRGPLLLTAGTKLTSHTGDWIGANRDGIALCYVFGGISVVAPSVVDQIDARLGN